MIDEIFSYLPLLNPKKIDEMFCMLKAKLALKCTRVGSNVIKLVQQNVA